MHPVYPKKHLGQHFLTDNNIARKIVDCLPQTGNCLEIGPGTGILTKFLIAKNLNLKVVEIDSESVNHLAATYPELHGKIIPGDFLRVDPQEYFDGEFSIIGNFPYNISSQIFFRIIGYREMIPTVVGMVQKEVAMRLAASQGNKTYGILTVLLGAFFNIEILFTVGENVFFPPPKVKSAVIRLIRKPELHLPCSEKLFFEIVKTSFNQRRKMLRNSLRHFLDIPVEPGILIKRPEQLSVQEFITLVQAIEQRRQTR